MAVTQVVPSLRVLPRGFTLGLGSGVQLKWCPKSPASCKCRNGSALAA